MTAVAVAAVVLGAFMAVRGVSQYRGAKATAQAGSVAATEAGKDAKTIFSFRYDKLDQHLRDSEKTMTTSFAKDFKRIAPALTKLAPQRKVVVDATTRAAAPMECGEHCSSAAARVLVFVDQSRTTSDTKLPTIFGQRVVFEMRRVDGHWLVNKIDAL